MGFKVRKKLYRATYEEQKTKKFPISVEKIVFKHIRHCVKNRVEFSMLKKLALEKIRIKKIDVKIFVTKLYFMKILKKVRV